MEVSVTTVIFSHLSDLQHNTKDLNTHVEFVKFLINKHLTQKVQIDPDAEYSEFLRDREKRTGMRESMKLSNIRKK